MDAKVVWQEGMAFEAALDGHTFTIDAKEEVGGRHKGPAPKGLTLVSLAGCTAMDVISILQKMREPVDSFEVATEAVVAEEHPKKFLKIVIKYRLTGQELSKDKVMRAVELSEENYCGVSATLRPAVKLSSEIYINGEKISG
jgi:putative redox protein